MSQYQVRVTAETSDADRKLDRVDKKIDKITAPKKINIQFPDIGKIGDSFDRVQENARQAANGIREIYNVAKVLPGPVGDYVRNIEAVKETTVSAATATKNAAVVARENANANTLLANSFKAASSAGGQFLDAISRIGFAMFGLQQISGALRASFGALFNETIGREAQFQATLLKSQTTLASTNKVFQGSNEITDPFQKIVTLTGAIEERIESIRIRSIDLAGVTSNDVVEVFGIVAGQIGQIGGGLKEAEELAIQFSAALGTFGLPLYQARQEIGSILRGDITQDSYLAKALLIDNDDIARAKTQAGGVVKFLEEKLQASVAGQKIAAQSLSGVWSNIRDIQELVGQSLGKGMLAPIITGLATVYDFISSIKEELFAAAEAVGNFIGRLGTIAAGTLVENVDLFKFDDSAIKSGVETVKGLMEGAIGYLSSVFSRVMSDVVRIINTLMPSILAVADAFGRIAKAVIEIKIDVFQSLATALANILAAMAPAIQALATMFNWWSRIVDLPIVQYFVVIGAQLALLRAMGLGAFLNIVAGLRLVVGFVIPAAVQFTRFVGTVISGVAQMILSIARFITSIGQMIIAFAAAMRGSQAFRVDLALTGTEITKLGAQTQAAGAGLAGLGAKFSAASLGAKGFAIAMTALFAKIAIFQIALAMIVDSIGKYQQQLADQKATKRAEQALQDLSTKYKNVTNTSENALKSQKQFNEALVNAEYDTAMQRVDELTEQMKKYEKSIKDVIKFRERLFGFLPSGVQEFFVGTGGMEKKLRELGVERDKAKAFIDEVNKYRDEQEKNDPNVRIQAPEQNRQQQEKAIAALKKQVQDDIFRAQQELGQKQISIAQLEGQLRIQGIVNANKRLIEGEEGRSAAALQALNNYIETRERAELDIETAKKNLAMELLNIEKTVADYRLATELKIAEIRKMGAQGDMAGGAAGGATTGAVGGVANVLGTNKPGAYNWNQGLGAPRSHGPHQGQDLGLDPGQKIFAIADGVVRAIIPQFGKVGKGVVLDYAQGNSGRYGHVEPVAGLKPGTRVKAGQQIATVTADGQNTHLHYELRTPDGRVLDPTKWLRQSLSVAGGVTTPSTGAPAPAAGGGGGQAATGGLPVNMNRFLNFIAEMESAMDNNAKNPTSGAAGRFQFTPITLQDAEQRFSISRQRILSSDFTTQKRAVAEFIQKAHKDAYEAINAGQFARAEQLLNRRWSALKGGSEEATGERRQRGEKFLAGAAIGAGSPAAAAIGIDIKPYEQAMKGYAAALQRVQALQAQLSRADTKEKLDEIAKALFPERQAETFDDRLIELKASLNAVASAAGSAYDPQLIALSVDQTRELAIMDREREQFLRKYAQTEGVTAEDRKRIADQIATRQQAYIKSLNDEFRKKKEILDLEREFETIQSLRLETQQIGANTAKEAINIQAGVIGSTFQDDPVRKRALQAEVEIISRKIDLESKNLLTTATAQAEFANWANALRQSAVILGQFDKAAQDFAEKKQISKDLASGMAEAQKGFVKSLLTGGDLGDSLTQMLESTADRFLNVILDQTFKPIEKMFEAQFDKVLGVDDPQKIFAEANTQALGTTSSALDLNRDAVANATSTLTQTNNLLQTLNQSLLQPPALAPEAAPVAVPAPEPVLPQGPAGWPKLQPLPPLPTPEIDTAPLVASTTQATQAVAAQADATGALAATATQTTPALGGIQGALAGIGQLAVGVMSIVGGIEMMGKGGTRNTLLGLAGIFGGIGGMFMGGFGGFFAKGGGVSGDRALVVGEQGPELFVPSSNGRIFSNPDTERMFKSTRQVLTESKEGKDNTASGNFVTESLSKPIDLRYESTVINNQEFVTVEQHRKGMREAAMQGRNMTMQALQYSLRSRKRLGL